MKDSVEECEHTYEKSMQNKSMQKINREFGQMPQKHFYAVRSAVGMELAREIMRSRYERKRWLLKKEPPRIVPLTLF